MSANLIIYLSITVVFLMIIIIGILLLGLRVLYQEVSLIRYTLMNFEKIVFDDLHVVRTELRYITDGIYKSRADEHLRDVRANAHKRE
jgi:hypothetical protein